MFIHEPEYEKYLNLLKETQHQSRVNLFKRENFKQKALMLTENKTAEDALNLLENFYIEYRQNKLRNETIRNYINALILFYHYVYPTTSFDLKTLFTRKVKFHPRKKFDEEKKNFSYTHYGKIFKNALDVCSADLNNKITWLMNQREQWKVEHKTFGGDLRKKVVKNLKISPYRSVLEKSLEIDTVGRLDSVLKLFLGSFQYYPDEDCFYIKFEIDKKRERGVFGLHRLSDVSLRLLCVYLILKSLHYDQPFVFDFNRFCALASRESMKNFLRMISMKYSNILLFSNIFGHKPSHQSFFKGIFYHDFFCNIQNFYEVGRHSVVDLLNAMGWDESDICRVTHQSLNTAALGWYSRERSPLYAPQGLGWCDVLLLSSSTDLKGFFCEGLASKDKDILKLLKKDIL